MQQTELPWESGSLHLGHADPGIDKKPNGNSSYCLEAVHSTHGDGDFGYGSLWRGLPH